MGSSDRQSGSTRALQKSFFPLCVLALLLILMLVGCGGARCPSKPFVESVKLESAYRSTRAYVTSFVGEARVEQRGDGGRVRATLMMMVEPPNHIRIDVSTQFGPVMTATYNGDVFAMFDIGRKRYRYGQNCEREIGRKLGVPFTASEMVMILLGDAPYRGELGQGAPSCGAHGYETTTKLKDGRTLTQAFDVREVDVDREPYEQRLRLREATMHSADGKVQWHVSYDDYEVVRAPLGSHKEVQGVAMPTQIQLEVPSEDINTVFNFKDIELNRALPKGAFQQEPDTSVDVRYMDCTHP